MVKGNGIPEKLYLVGLWPATGEKMEFPFGVILNSSP
jgi:hypothetical protein